MKTKINNNARISFNWRDNDLFPIVSTSNTKIAQLIFEYQYKYIEFQ